MALPAENTLETAQNLTTAGVDRATADAIATAIDRSHAHLATKDELRNELKRFATKDDLRNELKEIQAELKGMQVEQKNFVTKEYLDEALNNFVTKAEFERGQKEMMREFLALRVHLDKTLEKSFDKAFQNVVTKAEFERSHKDMQRQFISWMLSGIGIATVAIIALA